MIGYEISKVASLCLYCLGPDCCSLANCDSTDLSLIFMRRVVRDVNKSPELLSLLASTKPLYLEEMRVCCLFHFTADQLINVTVC